jgi:hypothetical protein
MGITEVVSGTLRGMGCEVDCALLVSHQERRAKHCTVLHAPDWLPDGYYQAAFRGLTAFLRRRQGAWSTGPAWSEVPVARRAA